MIQDTFKPVGIDKIVTDDLDFGTHIGGKKRENKWRSDDPNGLRSIVDEIRQEVGMNSRGAFPPGNSSKISNFMNHKLRGGDNDLIDGPEEYAFNKLHCREVDEPMERHKPTMKQTPKNDVYNREQYNYPYNAVYNNYQPDPEAYQENFSYKGYNQPRNNQYHGAGYNSDQASWYSYESYNSMGHPYYQGYQGNYDCGPQQNYGQPYYPNGPQHRMPTGQYVSRRVRKGAERDSPQMHPSQPAPIRSASPYSQGNNSYQEDEASESSDDEHANNSTSNKHSSPSKTKNQLKRFKQLIEAKPSNVLHVKGLENEEVSSELLNSLFSNFGNIIKILFVKHKQAAFIVYESQDLATISKEMLTNLRFMDCHLKITFSNESTFEKILAKENQNQLLVPNPKFYRFKDRKISINPPSKTLHLSNVAREIYSETEIAGLFGEFCQIKKVKLLNKKLDDKCMALVELKCIEDALICIAALHNRIIFSRYACSDDRNLKISFTKSKI